MMYKILPLFVMVLLVLGGCKKNKEKLQLEGEREYLNLTHTYEIIEDAPKTEPILITTPKDSMLWQNPGGDLGPGDDHYAMDIPFDEEWSTKVSHGGKDSRILTLPVSDGDFLYVLSALGEVHKLDLKTGNKVWVKTITASGRRTGMLGGGLCMDGDKIFAGTGEGEAFCLNKDTGEVIWEKSLSAPMRGQPMAAGDKVFFVTIDNRIAALDMEKGETLWTHGGIEESTALLGGGYVQLAYNSVIVPYSSGEVFGLDQDSGHPLWVQSLSSLSTLSHYSRIPQIKAQPVADRHKAYLSSHGGVFMAVDLGSGMPVWTRQLGSSETPVQGSNVLFTLTNDGRVVCLMKETGKVKWIRKLPKMELKFQDDELPDLETMDVSQDATGSLTWHSPLLVNYNLFVFGSDGTVLSFNPTTGSLRSSFKLKHNYPIGAIIVNGKMIVVTQTGQIMAYGPVEK